MILGEVAKFFEVTTFSRELQRVARGVTRVSIQSTTPGPGYFATGWLLTDDLVVTVELAAMGITLSPDETFLTCQFQYKNGKTFEVHADLLVEPTSGNSQALHTLLRLRKPLPGRALGLEGESMGHGKVLYVLQYPQGNPQLHFSIGSLLSVEESWLRYDADTQPGSSGSPVFSSNWSVAAMHHKSGMESNRYNEGISIAKILEGLRASPAWEEIARYHNLAGVSSAVQEAEISRGIGSDRAPVDDLVSAAVRWNFNPEDYAPEDAERLSTLVGDSSEPRWSLRASERQRLIRSAGSLKRLRAARGKEVIEGPGQQVIDRILKGPPYQLSQVAEAELPYWLQATRWFAEVIPSLPTPAEVNRTLEQRRVRSRFAELAGENFRGRQRELKLLQDWYSAHKAGPMVISGIGGIGKSALVSRFASGQPQEALLLWLDFDRPDLAPDDAVSVLTLLYRQASVQLEDFSSPTLNASAWRTHAEDFGASLAKALKGAPSPLLILDGFEVAQHVRQYQEIWGLLDLILKKMPALRVIVSGRAAVKGLRLNGHLARSLPLTGMARQDAAAWLRDRGINSEKVLKRVLDLAKGVPLVLQLAVRWVETGGEVSELPEKLPQELVQGFLYQRILDRVIDPVLKPVVRDALVLRYLTVEMLPKIFQDSLPSGMKPQDVFSRLQLELGIVGGEDVDPTALTMTLAGRPGVLHLRPEVRSATLKLLEQANAGRVKQIDERAVAWYKKQDLNEIANAAELIYHDLRLGNLEEAEISWRDDCAPLLLFAEEDIPAALPAARTWLRNHGVGKEAEETSLVNWEGGALKQIHSANSRGQVRLVPEILAKRKQRSEGSPLIIYDAWSQWKAGSLENAREVLEEAKPADGRVERDRTILKAFFTEQAGERSTAYQLLDQASDVSLWGQQAGEEISRLAVSASQVHLTVDLPAEMELLKFLEQSKETSILEDIFHLFFAPMDVVMPALRQHIQSLRSSEIAFSLPEIPLISTDLSKFTATLMNAREAPFLLPLDFDIKGSLQDYWDIQSFVNLLPVILKSIKNPWRENLQKFAPVLEGLSSGNSPDIQKSALNLALFSWHRWRIAATTTYLAQVYDLIEPSDKVNDPLALSIIGTLAAFNGQQFQIPEKRKGFTRLEQVLSSLLFKQNFVYTPVLSPARAAAARQLVKYEKRSLPVDLVAPWLGGGNIDPNLAQDTEMREFFPRTFLSNQEKSDSLAVLLYQAGPQPLEMLCRRILGLPDDLDWRSAA